MTFFLLLMQYVIVKQELKIEKVPLITFFNLKIFYFLKIKLSKFMVQEPLTCM